MIFSHINNSSIGEQFLQDLMKYVHKKQESNVFTEHENHNKIIFRDISKYRKRKMLSTSRSHSHRVFNSYDHKQNLSTIYCPIEHNLSFCARSYCEYNHIRRLVCRRFICNLTLRECNLLHRKQQRIMYPNVYELRDKYCKYGKSCHNVYCRHIHPSGTQICYYGAKCIYHPQKQRRIMCSRNHPPLY
jgi:hypothetical protein